jgi:1-acyl-sn-glycerol-3-phosphate acyltransferase
MTEIKPATYRDERPASSMDRFHAWARTHAPGWTYPIVRVIFTPLVLTLYRARSTGRGNVPAQGAFILAPNHFSNMDHFFCGVFVRREIRFMTKSQFFDTRPRVLGELFRISGHFPVRRGHADEEAFATAHAILARGECVGMYAEGGRSRTGTLGEPRAGIGRLALESGVPVVPVAIRGSLGVRDWRRGRFPRITVVYGVPLRFPPVRDPTREQSLEAAHAIFDRVRALYGADAPGSGGSVSP